MKVFFDARFTRTSHHDGISRYGANLLAELAKLTEVTGIISDDRQRALLPDTVDYVKLNSPISPRELLIGRTLNKLGADVVFSPMQVMGAFGRRYRLILTLHDLIYYSHPEPPHDLPRLVRGIWRLYHKAYWPQRLLLNRADAVASVSETTARLIRKHRLTRRPVHVIGNAADPTPPAQRDNTSQARSLVYMGAFLPYKNVETLIASLEHLPGYTLHLLSRIRPERRDSLTASAPDSARVIFHDGVTDQEYRRLLDEATALVTASLDEGFGLPLVEAMGRSTPIVVSDLEIFREIGGDTALYFEPRSPKQLADRIHELENTTRWMAASEQGPAQAEKFSWQESAARLHELITQLAAEPRRR
ncbi:glycosyltransferase family 1 protein [Saxibacter everestensis]|uniref:Glycosyltransferase family 1 protein n=1 Tax=Saxibacter everestensis TaxID=2909229 RepID=A0ABY8R025_9MICO|nr:glycosyltransferase family 1 protein [Brevibacteriaceae bacterium ZFBP1038]